MKPVPTHFHWLTADDNCICIVGWSHSQNLKKNWFINSFKNTDFILHLKKKSIGAWTTYGRCVRVVWSSWNWLESPVIFVGFPGVSNTELTNFFSLWLIYSTSNFIMVLPHSKESNSKKDSQKPARADFPTRSFLCILLFLLGLLTSKKFEIKLVAKKKVILKPRLLAFMDLLVVIVYD